MRKKSILVLYICLSVLILVIAIVIDNLNSSKNEIEYTNAINMSIKKESLSTTGATIIINDSTNKKNEYAEDFYIEQEKNGNWISLKKKYSSIPWNAMIYFIDKNNELELEQNWVNIYGELSQGNYRLIKYVLMPKENGSVTKINGDTYEYYKFYVEFTID